MVLDRQAQALDVDVATIAKQEDIAVPDRDAGEHDVRVRYLHSDIDTVERVEIIRDLRLGEFDVLVGINLLREGLDMPEKLDRKIDIANLSGIDLFLAKTYNENLLLYAVICTVSMAALGIIIAYPVDMILGAMGMEVHKIEHKE